MTMSSDAVQPLPKHGPQPPFDGRDANAQEPEGSPESVPLPLDGSRVRGELLHRPDRLRAPGERGGGLKLHDTLRSQGIGDTLLARSRNLAKSLELAKVFLKFEGGNPTGTMKDRSAFACLDHARRLGYRELSIGSCGNFGAAFVRLGPMFGVQCHVYIPERYEGKRIDQMAEEGGIIHKAPGSYEDAVALSSREAAARGWYDANPGVKQNTVDCMEAYATISYEICEALGRAPYAVAVPVGNGTTIAGIFQGFVDLKREAKIDSLPIMVAASTPGGNPVVKDFLAGESMIHDLKPDEITETPLNEPLVSWICLDGQEALDALRASSGFAAYVEDAEMLEMARVVANEEGILSLPASASCLVALRKFASQRSDAAGKDLVAVLTARQS